MNSLCSLSQHQQGTYPAAGAAGTARDALAAPLQGAIVDVLHDQDNIDANEVPAGACSASEGNLGCLTAMGGLGTAKRACQVPAQGVHG